MKNVLVYNTRELFEEYNSIILSMQHLNSIVQNNMVLDHTETVEFFNLINKKIEELKQWKDKVLDKFSNNLISEQEAEMYEEILLNNNGKIPELE